MKKMKAEFSVEAAFATSVAFLIIMTGITSGYKNANAVSQIYKSAYEEIKDNEMYNQPEKLRAYTVTKEALSSGKTAGEDK